MTQPARSPQVTVFSDIDCELGEGPTYHPATRTAWWFDIEGRKLLEKRADDLRTRVHPLPLMASALAFVDDERQLVAAQDGLYLREMRTGRLTLHRPLEDDNPVTRSNDARTHTSGAFWIGTMGIGAERGAGAIYWYRAGELKTLFRDITIPNSICFSPDGRTAYFTDTVKTQVMRVAVDPLTGFPEGEPGIFHDKRGETGGLDGSVCDADGIVWNARWGTGRLDAYAPNGERIRSIDIGARQVSCPAFVGENLDRMIVTSAWTSMDEAGRRADPDAGRTFLVDGPFKGRADPRVML